MSLPDCRARIAVLVSGGGTNLQALIDAEADEYISHGVLVAVISSNPDAYALERAMISNIPRFVADRAALGSQAAFEEAILNTLEAVQADIVVLAGFMHILSAEFVARYEGRIINVHPSLIPAFCGKGYYGLRVHEAALERGVKLTGATVHLVNEVPDGGEILLQRAVAVEPGDTSVTLQRRVMEQAEWIILPQAVEQISARIAATRLSQLKPMERKKRK